MFGIIPVIEITCRDDNDGQNDENQDERIRRTLFLSRIEFFKAEIIVQRSFPAASVNTVRLWKNLQTNHAFPPLTDLPLAEKRIHLGVKSVIIHEVRSTPVRKQPLVLVVVPKQH